MDRAWPSDTLIMVSSTHRDVYTFIQGPLRPGSLVIIAAASTATPLLPVFCDVDTDPAGHIRRRKNACQNIGSILHILMPVSAKLTVQTYEGKSEGPRNGQAAWQHSGESTLAVHKRRIKQTMRCLWPCAWNRGKTSMNTIYYQSSSRTR